MKDKIKIGLIAVGIVIIALNVLTVGERLLLKDNRPYIPEDYYAVKIEYAADKNIIKARTDPEWISFVNAWNLTKAEQENGPELWTFRLTFGKEAIFEPNSGTFEFSGKTIEVLLGSQKVYIDGEEYHSPNYNGLIEALIQRWDKIPVLE